MDNKVFLNNEDIIEEVYVGDQDGFSVQETLVKNALPLIEHLKSQSKQVLVLVDLLQIGMPNASARAVAQKALQELDFEKLAVYTENVYIKYVATFVIKASGKSEKIKVFKTRDEALAWLKQ